MLGDAHGRIPPATAAEDDALFRRIIRELKEIVFRTDAEGRWTFLNPAWEEITGFSVEESLGTPALDYVYPEDRERNQEFFRALIERRKQDGAPEIRYRKKCGGFCWVEVDARPAFDGSGTPSGACGTIRDVTRRHIGVAELRSTKARFEFLLESSPAVVASARLEPGYPVTYISANITGLLGYRPEDFTRHPFFWAGIVHPEDRAEVNDAIARAATGGAAAVHLRAAHRDGTYRCLRCDLRRVPGAPGTVSSLVASIVDTTSTREAEENLAQREGILQALSAAAQHFLRNDAWEQQLESALVPLVEALGGDRLRLFRFTDAAGGETIASLCHSWFRGDPPAADDASRIRTVPLVAAGLGRWLNLLRAHAVSAGHMTDLPEAERALLAKVGVEAIAAAPVFAGGVLWGSITLASAQPMRWSRAQLDALQAAAEIVGAAIHHQESREDLRLTKERLQCVIDSSPVVIFTADPATATTTWISDNVEALFGTPAADYIQNPQHWWQDIHPDDREKVAAFNRNLSVAGPNVIQIRHLDRDGAHRWVRIELKVIADRSGKPVELIGCLIDTTETMLALETLEKREAILRAVSFVAERFLYGGDWEQAVPAALRELGQAAGADRVRLIQKVPAKDATSPSLRLHCEWTDERVAWEPGRSVAEIPEWEDVFGRGETVAGLTDSLPPGARARLEPQGVQSIASVPIFIGSGHWGMIAFLRRTAKDWSRTTLEGMQVAAGIIGAAIRQHAARLNLRRAHDELEGHVRQRTEQLAAAIQALTASEQLYRTLVETSPDCILMMDLDRRITMINRRGLELFGCPPPEVEPGALLTDFLHPSEKSRMPERRRRLLSEGRLQGLAISMVRRDGAAFQAEMSVSLVPGPQGGPRGIIGIIRDVTERRQLEEQFRQAQKMEAIGRLAGGVAHDFNNLLTVIKGYSELLAKRLSADPSSSRKLAQIVKASDRAGALVEQLLAFSRKQMVEPKIVDLNASIRETERLLRRLIGDDIEFSTRLDEAAGRVHVDPSQLDQLILNLTVNARDAMPRGGSLGISTASVVLAAGAEPPAPGMPPGRYVQIEVKDTGVGMSEEVRCHIFEPFFTTKPVGKGTGLGLSTVYGIVRQSGGFIAVESAPGAGSAFRIYLPEAGEHDTVPSQPANEPERSGGSETILVAEDSDSVRAIIVETLSECGYNVLAARHGRHALAVAARFYGKIDLLLTDVMMPQMSGPELWEELKSASPGMRLLYISANTDRELDPRAPFLKKPFSPERLAAKVRETLDAANPLKLMRPVPSGSSLPIPVLAANSESRPHPPAAGLP